MTLPKTAPLPAPETRRAIRSRLARPGRVATLAAAVAAGLMLVPGEAPAQNFFERLFGIPPQPQAPPAGVPGRGGGPFGPQPVPGAPPGEEGPPRPAIPEGPPPPRPIALKAPSEDSALGRELKLNGTAGSLRIDRAGRDFRARIQLSGRRISDPVQTCTVPLGGNETPITAGGRPNGTARYEIQTEECSFALEVVDGAMLASGPTEACSFQAADCQADPRGLWGPEAASLIPRARDIEQARGTADRAVRENYRALRQRANPAESRVIVSEQAAFSSDREMTCRTYAREGAHGFCNARYTEARALALASRLGLAPGAAEPAPVAAAAPRPRRAPVPPPPDEAEPVDEPPPSPFSNPFAPRR